MNDNTYMKARMRTWHSRGVDITDYQEYVDMYNKAGGKCEVCGRQLSLKQGNSDKPTAQLDHDHKTHKPRGILCPAHNYVLGYLERRSKGYNKEVARYVLEKFDH